MMDTSESTPLDHNAGAGRIDPDRLGRLLAAGCACRGEGWVVRSSTTFLLGLLFASVISDRSPIAIFQDVVAWSSTVVTFASKLFVSLTT